MSIDGVGRGEWWACVGVVVLGVIGFKNNISETPWSFSMLMSAVLSESPSIVAPGNILAVTRRNVEIEELDAAIGKLTRQMNSCNYQLMVMLREFDERGGWLKWSFTDCISWLRWRCDLSANAARDKCVWRIRLNYSRHVKGI